MDSAERQQRWTSRSPFCQIRVISPRVAARSMVVSHVTPLDSWVSWRPFGDEQVSGVLCRLAGRASRRGAARVSARCASLPFYASYELIELQFAGDDGPEYVFGLDGPEQTVWLDGSSAPVHETNTAASLVLTDETVSDYIRFFFFFVRGDSGPFVLVEAQDDIDLASDGASDEQNGGTPEVGASELRARLQDLRRRASPLATRGVEQDGRWTADCTVAYGDALFASTLRVSSNGEVEMVDDEPIGQLDGLSVTEYRPLAGLLNEGEGEVISGHPPQGDGEVGPGADEPDELPRDRDVTEAIVTVLLEDAIRERDSDALQSSMLLRHFNAETGDDKPIDRLARLVVNSVPVIIVESDIPFVEDFVAGLIDGPDHLVSGGGGSRAGVLPGDELRCVVDLDARTKLRLLSFHAYRGLFDPERTAHELALGDATVLIGCERSADVPEPLRRIADLVLTFPRIDRGRFARIFERVFAAKPTPGWDAPGADWTRYLVPADFHMPRRLSLNPDEALRFLMDRVQTRLNQVTPDVGPRLSELHGLGEARQICEDFVTDIRAAQAGQIPWMALDRGLLLVGAPGTGKTTLARALARECGVKFVVASAASWQSSGALDAHLQAMRADFTEARRYAPAILFLDEIDSIGSRELIGGDRNIIYQTEVINALLEQIQGIATVDPVIVIAATNYLERVDPALRRAGRLDQAVQLPLPNIPSLEQIFAYYLGPYRADKQVARDVETRTLAELSLGLTGADVEFFVRGAARRARRANRKIKQEDLVAEITRRPRRPDSAPRLTKEEIRRVAVHEAGHALARLISSTHGEDITFITIIPRMDGSLGFVASVPSNGHMLTRRTMLAELETLLAGRAAEEVVFGVSDIGTGAGGPSSGSDLAVATKTAALLVCQSGLGEDGALRWTEQPTALQDTQIDALLVKAYSSIIARLDAQRVLLDHIVSILEDKQELSGTELRSMLPETGRSVLAAT
jgi:ATP-dependent Zn protease